MQTHMAATKGHPTGAEPSLSAFLVFLPHSATKLKRMSLEKEHVEGITEAAYAPREIPTAINGADG